MKTYSTDEHYNAGAEYAYVHLTDSLAKVIAGRFNLFEATQKSQPDIVEMHFGFESGEAGFFGWLAFNDDERGFLPGSDVEEKFLDDGWAEIPESSPFPGDKHLDSFNEVFGIEMEALYMIVGSGGVSWEAYPKHTSIRVQSEVLPREVVAKVI